MKVWLQEAVDPEHRALRLARLRRYAKGQQLVARDMSRQALATKDKVYSSLGRDRHVQALRAQGRALAAHDLAVRYRGPGRAPKLGSMVRRGWRRLRREEAVDLSQRANRLAMLQRALHRFAQRRALLQQQGDRQGADTMHTKAMRTFHLVNKHSGEKRRSPVLL